MLLIQEKCILGLYVEEDIEKGINYLEEAASVKDIYAVKLLAGYYFGNSDLIERDISKTIFYKKILAELNPNDAANLAEIGICYGMQQDYKNSYEYTNRAYKLDNNNKDANYNLGFLYENGFHVDKNLNKAIVYYEKALEQKYNLAAYALGFIYSNKDYQYHDVNKALDYFTKALNGGINAAIAYICDIYIWDKKEYKKVFEIATSEKYDPEYVAEALGDLYYNGYYVPVDYDKAYSCYTILENISSSIQYKIGRCYFFGHGVEMDKAKGHELIYLSAKANYKPALKFLNEFFK